MKKIVGGLLLSLVFGGIIALLVNGVGWFEALVIVGMSVATSAIIVFAVDLLS